MTVMPSSFSVLVLEECLFPLIVVFIAMTSRCSMYITLTQAYGLLHLSSVFEQSKEDLQRTNVRINDLINHSA